MRASRTSMRAEEGLEPPSDDPGVESGLHASQLRRALDDCRGKLGDDQRTVLALRYETRLESETIAARLGIHRNTVHVRVFRALQLLRECLTRKGFDPGDLP